MGFLDLKYETIGLDINDSSLKIVKLKKKLKNFELSSYNEVKIAPGVIEDGVIKKEATLARLIKYAVDTAKGKKIKTKYVVVSLPEEKSFSQVIQMPKMTEEELKLAVPFEAENYIPLSINDVYLDFQVIPSGKDYLNRLEVLIVAMPKKIVDSYVSCIQKAGFVPIVLESESEAIARALIKKENESLLSVLADFGEKNTTLVVYSGCSVRFTCVIPISSKMVTTAISEALEIDFHDAEKIKIEYGLVGKKHNNRLAKASKAIEPILENLANQIKKYLNFYQEHSSYEYSLGERKTDKILFCGGGAELKGLSSFMSEQLGVAVEIGDASVNLFSRKIKSVLKKDLSLYTTAIGLALRETGEN